MEANYPLLRIVVLQVRPRLEHVGQLIHLECQAWFDGVVHDTKDKLGLLQYELLFLPKN